MVASTHHQPHGSGAIAGVKLVICRTLRFVDRTEQVPRGSRVLQSRRLRSTRITDRSTYWEKDSIMKGDLGQYFPVILVLVGAVMTRQLLRCREPDYGLFFRSCTPFVSFLTPPLCRWLSVLAAPNMLDLGGQLQIHDSRCKSSMHACKYVLAGFYFPDSASSRASFRVHRQVVACLQAKGHWMGDDQAFRPARIRL